MRGTLSVRMPRTLSLWLAVMLLGCAPQSVDAVSCENAPCARAGGTNAAGATNAGGAGNGSGGGADAGTAGASTSALIHRYSFDPSPDGIEVIDSVRGMNGALVGAVYGSAEAAGTALLAGKTSNQYIDLPNHLLDGLRDATFEAWVNWAGGDDWQRIFDFGEDETGGDGNRNGLPRSYLFLACMPNPRFAFQPPPARSRETVATGATPCAAGTWSHFAVVIDQTRQLASLFVNGVESESTRFVGSLADVYDVNNWLGRSEYLADPGFEGSFSEFRIYDRALSVAEVAASFDAGPDASVW